MLFSVMLINLTLFVLLLVVSIYRRYILHCYRMRTVKIKNRIPSRKPGLLLLVPEQSVEYMFNV